MDLRLNNNVNAELRILLTNLITLLLYETAIPCVKGSFMRTVRHSRSFDSFRPSICEYREEKCAKSSGFSQLLATLNFQSMQIVLKRLSPMHFHLTKFGLDSVRV